PLSPRTRSQKSWSRLSIGGSDRGFRSVGLSDLSRLHLLARQPARLQRVQGRALVQEDGGGVEPHVEAELAGEVAEGPILRHVARAAYELDRIVDDGVGKQVPALRAVVVVEVAHAPVRPRVGRGNHRGD